MAVAHAKGYLDIQTAIYKVEARSSVLLINPELVKEAANAKNVLVKKITVDKPANYSRATGYVGGDVSVAWQEVVPAYDRGRIFPIDVMDAEEARISAGEVRAKYLKEGGAADIDAFVFDKIASTQGVQTPTGAALSTGQAVLSALETGLNFLDEQEVPKEGRFVFITPTLARLARGTASTGTALSVLDEVTLIEVPQSRFYKGVTFYDGTTTGQEGGSYVKTATTGVDINFLIVHKEAVFHHMKHRTSDLIEPKDNQTRDGYIFKFRDYGYFDIVTQLDDDSKIKGIYAHVGAASAGS